MAPTVTRVSNFGKKGGKDAAKRHWQDIEQLICSKRYAFSNRNQQVTENGLCEATSKTQLSKVHKTPTPDQAGNNQEKHLAKLKQYHRKRKWRKRGPRYTSKVRRQLLTHQHSQNFHVSDIEEQTDDSMLSDGSSESHSPSGKFLNGHTPKKLSLKANYNVGRILIEPGSHIESGCASESTDDESESEESSSRIFKSKASDKESVNKSQVQDNFSQTEMPCFQSAAHKSDNMSQTGGENLAYCARESVINLCDKQMNQTERISHGISREQHDAEVRHFASLVKYVICDMAGQQTSSVADVCSNINLDDCSTVATNSSHRSCTPCGRERVSSDHRSFSHQHCDKGNFGSTHCHIGSPERLQGRNCLRKAQPVLNPFSHGILRCCSCHCHQDSTNICTNTHSKPSPLISNDGQSQYLAAYQQLANQKNSAFEPSSSVIMKCCCDNSQHGRADLRTGCTSTLSFEPLPTQHSEYGIAQANSTMTYPMAAHQKKTSFQNQPLISSFEAITPSTTRTEASTARNCATPAASQLSAASVSPPLCQRHCSRPVSHQNQRYNMRSSAIVNHAEINLPWHLAHFPIPRLTTPVPAGQGICEQPLDFSSPKMNTTNTSALPMSRNMQPGQSVLDIPATRTSTQREFKRPEPIYPLQTQQPGNKQHSRPAGKGGLEESSNRNTGPGHRCVSASKGIPNEGLPKTSVSITLCAAKTASQEKLSNCNLDEQHCSTGVGGGLCRAEPQDTLTLPCAGETVQVMQLKSNNSVLAPKQDVIPVSHDSSRPMDKSFVNSLSSDTYSQLLRGRGKDSGRYAWAITLQADDEDLFKSQNVMELNQRQAPSSNTEIVEHNENHPELEMEVESAVDQSVDVSPSKMQAKERSSHVSSQKSNKHPTEEKQLECSSDNVIQEVIRKSPSPPKEAPKRIGECTELYCATTEGPKEKKTKLDDSKCTSKDTQYNAPQINEELSRKTRSSNSKDLGTKKVQNSNMDESDCEIVFEDLDQSDLDQHESEGKPADPTEVCAEEGSPHHNKQHTEEEQHEHSSDDIFEEVTCESANAPKQDTKKIGECTGLQCATGKDPQEKRKLRSSNTKDLKNKKGQKSKKEPSKVKSKAVHASTPVEHEKKHFSPSPSEGKLCSRESGVKTSKTLSKKQQDNADDANMDKSDCEMMFEELDPSEIAHIMLVLRQQELLLQKENGGSVTSPSDQRLLFRKLKAAQLPLDLQTLRVLCARKNWSSPPHCEKISALRLLELNLKEKSQDPPEEERIIEKSSSPDRKVAKKKKVSPLATRMRPLPVCFLRKKGTPEDEPKALGREIDSKQNASQIPISNDTSPTGITDKKGKSRREAIRGKGKGEGAKRKLDLPVKAGKEPINDINSKISPKGHESDSQNVEKSKTSNDETTSVSREPSPRGSSVVLAKRNSKNLKTRGKSHDAKTLKKSSQITDSLTPNQSEKSSPPLSPGSCPDNPSVPATSIQIEESNGDNDQNSVHDWTVQLTDRQIKEKKRWLNSREENLESSSEPVSPVSLANDSLQNILPLQGKTDLVGDATVSEVALAHDVASHVILDDWRNVRSLKCTKRFIYPMYDKKIVLGALWDLRNHKDTEDVTKRILSLQWKNVHPVAFHTMVSMFVLSLSRLSAYHVERCHGEKGSSISDSHSSTEENQTIRSISTPVMAVASRLILKGEQVDGMVGLLLEVNESDAANLRKWSVPKFSCGQRWTILGPIAYLRQNKQSNTKLCLKNGVQVFAQATCDIPIGQQIFTTYSSIEKSLS